MLTAEDSERLLCYLTVPHLAAPLVVIFFSEGTRLWALSNPQMQALLESVLFTPREGSGIPDGAIDFATLANVRSLVPTPAVDRTTVLGEHSPRMNQR